MSRRRIKIKVEDIQQIGHVDLRRILSEHEYNITRVDTNFVLPTWRELKDTTWGFDDLRIQITPLEYLVYTNLGVFKFKYKPGYITDLASVPKFVRSFIDNDDKRLVRPSMMHDPLFVLHTVPFDMTNSLFRAATIFENKNKKFLANMVWLAVSSFVGKRRWKQKRPLWSHRNVEIEWLPNAKK